MVWGGRTGQQQKNAAQSAVAIVPVRLTTEEGSTTFYVMTTLQAGTTVWARAAKAQVYFHIPSLFLPMPCYCRQVPSRHRSVHTPFQLHTAGDWGATGAASATLPSARLHIKAPAKVYAQAPQADIDGHITPIRVLSCNPVAHFTTPKRTGHPKRIFSSPGSGPKPAAWRPPVPCASPAHMPWHCGS